MEVCEPVEGELAADVNVAGLAGAYRLTLVATQGDSAGTTVEGRLALVPHDSAARVLPGGGGQPDPTVSMPLYGSADVNVEAVHALRLGDLMSVDPMSPGVVVFEHHGTLGDEPVTGITLRLGSLANRRGVTLFDGGYTVLRANWVEEGGFGGSWASGTMSPQSEGYFCAVRSEED